MSQRYIAFDVETPNSFNDRMSAIGITVIEDNNIVDTFYSLVNPEAKFDDFNIQLTGITPEMVAGSLNFAQLWQEIEPIMDSGLLIAHNAPFDMSVLAKCLTAYHIESNCTDDRIFPLYSYFPSRRFRKVVLPRPFLPTKPSFQSVSTWKLTFSKTLS